MDVAHVEESDALGPGRDPRPALVEGFYVAHFRYLREEYGGKVGPAGYLKLTTVTPTRPQGLPHGFSWVVKRLMDNKPYPIVPIFQNPFLAAQPADNESGATLWIERYGQPSRLGIRPAVARTPGLRSPAGTGHADAFAIWR